MDKQDKGRFTDDWNRSDGPIGNGWRSSHEDHGEWWDPLEVRGKIPVNINPDRGPIVQPHNSGGRASAYRDFGEAFVDRIRIGILWNGNHQAPGFPIACINSEDPNWGLAFCYEPEIAGGIYALWAMGRRPDQIKLLHSEPGDHRDGQSVFFEMKVSSDMVTCLADQKEILTYEIPAPLVGSSVHGFGLDVNPIPGRPPNVEVICGPFMIERDCRHTITPFNSLSEA